MTLSFITNKNNIKTAKQYNNESKIKAYKKPYHKIQNSQLRWVHPSLAANTPFEYVISKLGDFIYFEFLNLAYSMTSSYFYQFLFGYLSYVSMVKAEVFSFFPFSFSFFFYYLFSSVASRLDSYFRYIVWRTQQRALRQKGWGLHLLLIKDCIFAKVYGILYFYLTWIELQVCFF